MDEDEKATYDNLLAAERQTKGGYKQALTTWTGTMIELAQFIYGKYEEGKATLEMMRKLVDLLQVGEVRRSLGLEGDKQKETLDAIYARLAALRL